MPLLKQARKDAGLTQRDVAARLSMPHSYPHKVENGQRDMNLVELLDFCDALGVDFVQLMGDFKAAVNDWREFWEK